MYVVYQGGSSGGGVRSLPFWCLWGVLDFLAFFYVTVFCFVFSWRDKQYAFRSRTSDETEPLAVTAVAAFIGLSELKLRFVAILLEISVGDVLWCPVRPLLWLHRVSLTLLSTSPIFSVAFVAASFCLSYCCILTFFQVFAPADFAFESIGITNETVLNFDPAILTTVRELCENSCSEEEKAM